MEHVAHAARLDALMPLPDIPREKWPTLRAHHTAIANNPNAGGREASRLALVSIEYPDWLNYLYAYHRELWQRSGSMNGELTWPAYDAWARAKHMELEGDEIDALFLLDAVRRFPDSLKEETKPKESDASAGAPQWPSKKKVTSG